MVNEQVGNSEWEDGSELGATWETRNAFSYGRCAFTSPSSCIFPLQLHLAALYWLKLGTTWESSNAFSHGTGPTLPWRCCIWRCLRCIALAMRTLKNTFGGTSTSEGRRRCTGGYQRQDALLGCLRQDALLGCLCLIMCNLHRADGSV